MLFELALLIGLVGPLQRESPEPSAPMPKLSACTPVGAKAVYHLSDLQPEAVARLNRFFKEGFADAGAPFNSTDVIRDHAVPQRRFYERIIMVINRLFGTNMVAEVIIYTLSE